MTEPLRLEIEGAVARLTLARPECGNAIDGTLIHALLRAVSACDADPAVRSVLMTGEGKLFCGGGDIDAFRAAGDDSLRIVSEQAGVFHAAIARLARMNKPLIVAVNGPAAGAGLSLAALGDIVLVHPEAHFTFAYTAAGLSPDGGASWLLPRLIGLRRTQEFALLGARVGAEEAVAMGLATRVSEDPVAEGLRIAQKLATGPVRAMGRLRALLLSSFDTSLETQLELEARGIAASSADPEGREGVRAFLEKRPPRFDAT